MNEVKVIFIGDAAQLFQTADKVEARMVNLGQNSAAKIANPFTSLQTSLQSGTQQVNNFVNQTVAGSKKIETAVKSVSAVADPGPTISYWRNHTEAATQSLDQIAAEKTKNDELDARAQATATTRLKASLRVQEAEEYAANERRLRALSVTKHEQYLADKAAEEGITNTAKKENDKRSELFSNGRLRGLGPVFRATGLYEYGIDETTINAALALADSAKTTQAAKQGTAVASAAVAVAETETAAAATAAATAETEFAGAATVAAGAATETAAATTVIATEAAVAAIPFAAIAVVAGVAAAAIYVAYQWTSQIRKEADDRLKVELAIGGAINRQVLYAKNITEEFKKQRKETEANREQQTAAKDVLSGRSLDDLKAKRKELEDINKLVSATEFNIGTRRFEEPEDVKNARAIRQAQISALDEEIYKRDQTEKTRPQISYSNIADQESKVRAEAAETYAKNIDEATKKVIEANKSAADAFNEIPHYVNNPFVDLYSKGEKALISFEEKTQGLTESLRRQGEELIKQNTSLDAFNTRIDTSLSAYGLRSTATRFRQPTANEQAFYLNQTIARYQRESNSTNPDIARYFATQGNIVANYDRIQQQKSINDQLDILFNTRVKNEDERGVRDTRIAQFAQNLDPDLLSTGRRKEVADIFDKQAERTERREIDAFNLQKKQTEYLKNISDHFTGVLNEAVTNPQAAAAVGAGRLDIRVTDATSEKKVTNATVATEGDVAKTYSLGFFQGTNE